MRESLAVILGSAYQKRLPAKLELEKIEVETKWGSQTVFRLKESGRPAYILFRHGLPHKWLPHQIPYRAQAAALQKLGCKALVVTSSVGVMNADLPLFKPLLLSDLIMLENRLPDGSACTMFNEYSPGQGHLVLSEGLFSRALTRQLYNLAPEVMESPETEVIFAYAGGPRSKTPAENRLWPKLGADVNSMTLAPEVVLANELEIPCAGLVVGHKYSIPGINNPENYNTVTETLDKSREAMEWIVIKFLKEGQSIPFGNHIYRYNEK